MINNNSPILLVEDDLVDSMTVKRAVKEVGIGNPITVAENGEDALDYLHTTDKLPCLILLDINMPRMNGLEFLENIKHDPKYRRIPVIILTTSQEDQDKYKSFDLHAAGYMVKPVDYEQFIQLMKTIQEYWSVSKFP